jgi:hypothetical protein
MHSAVVIDQPKALEGPDKDQKQLDRRLQASFPKKINADQHDQPFQGGDDGPVMVWVRIGNRAEKTPIAEGEEMPMGIFGVNGKVLEVMEAHGREEIGQGLLTDQEAQKKTNNGQGKGMSPIHPKRPEVILVKSFAAGGIPMDPPQGH